MPQAEAAAPARPLSATALTFKMPQGFFFTVASIYISAPATGRAAITTNHAHFTSAAPLRENSTAAEVAESSQTSAITAASGKKDGR